MTKWTPGPWLSASVLSQETGYGWDINANEIWLGTVFNSHQGHEGFPADDVGEANAHLIAAAPELYAALEALKPWIKDQIEEIWTDYGAAIQEGATFSPMNTMETTIWQNALDAMAKARGES